MEKYMYKHESTFSQNAFTCSSALSIILQKMPLRIFQEASFVEMGGLEPPSIHRTRQLSTRLVSLWFSSGVCRKTGQLQLIL